MTNAQVEAAAMDKQWVYDKELRTALRPKVAAKLADLRSANALLHKLVENRDARVALVAAQAGEPNVDFVKIGLAISSALAWQPSESSPSYREQRDAIEALIREALRPPAAPAESNAQRCASCGEYMPPHARHMCANWPPPAASEPAAPSEEDVARVLEKAAYLAQASHRAMRDHGGAEKFLDLNASVAAFEEAREMYLALLQRGKK